MQLFHLQGKCNT